MFPERMMFPCLRQGGTALRGSWLCDGGSGAERPAVGCQRRGRRWPVLGFERTLSIAVSKASGPHWGVSMLSVGGGDVPKEMVESGRREIRGNRAPSFLTNLRRPWDPSTCPGQVVWRLPCSRQGWEIEPNMPCLFQSTGREGPGRWTTSASGVTVTEAGRSKCQGLRERNLLPGLGCPGTLPGRRGRFGSMRSIRRYP